MTNEPNEPAVRFFNVRAFGDTVEEIELYALDRAVEFFGRDVTLTVQRTYIIGQVDPDPGNAVAKEAGGKKYHASISVAVGNG